MMPVAISRSVTVLLALAVCIPIWGCAGGKGFHPILGKPRAGSMITVQQPEGRRFNFIVHVVNSDPKLWDREVRRKQVVQHLKGKCLNPQVEDLYVHDAGYWPDGGKKVTFTLGVLCDTPL